MSGIYTHTHLALTHAVLDTQCRTRNELTDWTLDWTELDMHMEQGTCRLWQTHTHTDAHIEGGALLLQQRRQHWLLIIE